MFSFGGHLNIPTEKNWAFILRLCGIHRSEIYFASKAYLLHMKTLELDGKQHITTIVVVV